MIFTTWHDSPEESEKMKVKKGILEFVCLYIVPMTVLAVMVSLSVYWCFINYYDGGLTL